MKTTMTILAAFVVIGWSSGASAVPIEWTVASGGNGHYYERVLQTTTWQEAKDAADLLQFNGVQGHLITITSTAEQNFLLAEFPESFDENGSFWLGGFQNHDAPDYSEPAGGWQWVTGESFGFSRWESGEPNNDGDNEDFLETAIENWEWNDLDSTDLNVGFYVEYPIPEPSAFFLTAIGLFALTGVSLHRRR